MPERLLATAAWLTLAFIAYSTLSPLGLRPEVTNPDIERFCAYTIAGFLFVMAYPRRTILVLAIVIGAAIVLEALQLLTPDRHGKFANLVVKASGGIAGVVSAAFIYYLVRSKRERSV
jgi:VanZ family protein